MGELIAAAAQVRAPDQCRPRGVVFRKGHVDAVMETMAASMHHLIGSEGGGVTLSESRAAAIQESIAIESGGIAEVVGERAGVCAEYQSGVDHHGVFRVVRAKLEADPSLIPNAVQELIRWQTPLAHMRRTALSDTELEGHTIKAGQKVIMWYISANRDESIFPNADKLDIKRENARRHLSFGYGIHRCVGARLAELQITILLEEMAKRRMRVNVLEEPVRVAQSFVNGYRKMMVQLEKY